MHKGLRYFIIFDLILALLLIINFNFKSKNDGANITSPAISFLDKISLYIKGQSKPQTNDVNDSSDLINNPSHITEEIIKPATMTAPSIEKNKNNTSKVVKPLQSPNVNNIVSNGNYFKSSINGGIFASRKEDSKEHSPICITYGPLDLEQKSLLDVIINNNRIDTSTLQMSKAPLFEVYWNLGTNKVQAVERFEKQKNDGALQDEKFKLTQTTEGEWIVPISTVAGNLDIAKKMIRDLSKSANSIGGKWQYRTKTEGYFYQFKDMSIFPNNTIDKINHSIDTLKTPC